MSRHYTNATKGFFGNDKWNDFNPADYQPDMKDYCVSCGRPTKQNWKHYFLYGNYCIECGGRITRNAQKNKVKI